MTTTPGPTDQEWIAANDLQTALGPVSTLDLSRPDVARMLLQTEKAQIVDGLLAELIFDSIIDAIPLGMTTARPAAEILRPDVETIIADASASRGEWLAFVWPRELSRGVGRYLTALAAKFHVLVVEYDAQRRQFHLRETSNGRASRTRFPLAAWISKYSGRKPTKFEVDDSVRSPLRHAEVWQHLVERCPGTLTERIVLPRILVNCGIQPWFRAVWNVDRILVAGDTIWAMELKHKFPIPGQPDRDPLAFGLNHGQQTVYERLDRCGLRCLHMILSKPFWSKETGAAYLVTDPEARAHAALLATILDESHFQRLGQQATRQSGTHTTITAQQSSHLNYRPIPVSDFYSVGVLSDDVSAIAERVVNVMSGAASQPATDELLHSLKLERPPVLTASG